MPLKQITMNFNKQLLTIFYSILLSSSLFGQNKSQETDWRVIKEDDGIIFYAQRQECAIIEGQKPLHYTFLKIENTTPETKNLRFSFGLQYTEGCSGCDEFEENLIELSVPANTILTGDCTFELVKLSRLIYNPNLAGGWKFEKEVITNLSVK